jgi:hypothetical protein
MMASRGMGDISPSKMPKGKKTARRDDTDFTEYKKGGSVKPVWDRPRPKELGKPSVLTAVQKASAKAKAKAAGRPYPNLVDNMRAARRKK